jgi:hypothetical protein
MFPAHRHLFHREPAAPAKEPAAADGTKAQPRPIEHPRHPAMRGLNVSPVHGHHCICDRCGHDRAA